MPEVTLGIIPGAGGTQRMPRLIGADKALDLILAARPIDVAQASALGFIDEVVAGDLRAGAVSYTRRLLAAGRGPRRTSALRVDPSSATPAIFDAMQQRARELYPNRNAGLVAIAAVRAAASLPFQAGLEYETQRVNECKRSDESRGAVHAFFAERETRRIPGLSKDATSRQRSEEHTSELQSPI